VSKTPNALLPIFQVMVGRNIPEIGVGTVRMPRHATLRLLGVSCAGWCPCSQKVRSRAGGGGADSATLGLVPSGFRPDSARCGPCSRLAYAGAATALDTGGPRSRHRGLSLEQLIARRRQCVAGGHVAPALGSGVRAGRAEGCCWCHRLRLDSSFEGWTAIPLPSSTRTR
jgi:hypothetical protein